MKTLGHTGGGGGGGGEGEGEGEGEGGGGGTDRKLASQSMIKTLTSSHLRG